jgi:hypothetical protein
VYIRAQQWAALVVSYLGVIVVFGHDISLEGGHVLWIGAGAGVCDQLRAVFDLQRSGQACPSWPDAG